MKHKLVLLLLLLLVAAGPLLAAPVPDSARVTHSTEYQDRQFRRSTSAEGAVYRVETTLIDSIRGIERLYSLPSGKLYSYQAFIIGEDKVWHGSYLEFYEDGKTRLQQIYVQGEVQGERRTYYATGVLRRREQLTPGQPITGECFGPDGQPIAYFPFEQMPAYPGGTDALLRDIGQKLVYPNRALRDQVQGFLIVKFTVAVDGHLQHVRALELPAEAPASLHRTYLYLGDAAAQSVRRLRLFEPGRREGEPVAVAYEVPVSFSIR
ncbi:energy transducer TonB [Hymenobacter actinosclerus]|uniref:Protein TonB n=1 Tax=Hymenobacter actinosclerus TaxID=82805 RepID=A0A1I0DQK1_9BACT|nr:energy transducer TonB [Hymenobacter actinosclerus]SET34837.1 protein TonB [Hymenobacter actinosclerus]